jgi:hypothetical protein
MESVLKTIDTAGQELLMDFIGTQCILDTYLNTYFISEILTLVVLQRMCSSSMGKQQLTTCQKFRRQWIYNHTTCSQEPAVFRQELFNTLTTYYEEIQSMSGAGRRLQPKHFKRRIIAAGGAAGGGALAAGGDDDEPPPPAADDAAPAYPAIPPAKKGGKGRAGPGGAKAQ